MEEGLNCLSHTLKCISASQLGLEVRMSSTVKSHLCFGCQLQPDQIKADEIYGLKKQKQQKRRDYFHGITDKQNFTIS